MGAVAQEKDRGTAVLVLVKPLRRSVFILTKFVALALAFLGGLALAGLGGYVYTLVLFGPPDPLGWLAMNLLLWLYILVFVALTLLASTLVKSQAAAAGLGFGIMMFFALLGAIPGMGKYLPGHLATWGAVLSGISLPGGLPNPWPALILSLALIVISLVAACAVFEKQEL
jgi:ABC-2 type transport system permease protein